MAKALIAYDSVKLINSGEEFFNELKSLIESAKATLHLQTYIFEDDETGLQVAKHLREAAQRGVKVFVLLDGFGSRQLSDRFLESLRIDGVFVRLFSRLFSFESGYIGRRLHHKVVVADSYRSLIGGINISDKYRGSPTSLPWLDFAVSITGACCEQLEKLCYNLYHRKLFTIHDGDKNALSRLTGVRFECNDWLKGKNQIHQSYVKGIKNSKESITLVASYFIPGPHFIQTITQAAKRGIKVRLLETGDADVPFFKLAEKYLYFRLLNAGIELYEWPGSVLHGKAMIVDNHWVTIGSYNVNYLSHYSSIELNARIIDKDFAKAFNTKIDDIINNHCHRINIQHYSRSVNFISRWSGMLAYSFIRFLLHLFQPKRASGNFRD